LLEPDLGTAIICGFIMLTLLWLAGANRKLLFLTIFLAILMIAWLYSILATATNGFTEQLNSELLPPWLPLEDYQLLRLVIFINPYMDPLGSGYQIIQSRIAIGAGGLWGRGFGQGSQVQGDFLPEHHTDFIFAVVGEEFGFIGTVGLLLLYLLLLLRGWRIALKAPDLLGSLLVGGIMFMLAFQLFLNIGMTIGLMPITGITLPLLSYGGSSLLFNMAALGLVFSVNLRQKQRFFV
jgi:rod shape determining protein RodA